MIIDRIIGKLSDYENSGLRVDRVMLDHYDMAKPHQKLRSQDGTVIGLSLDHGEHLFCGAVIYADDEKLIVADLIPEDVLHTSLRQYAVGEDRFQYREHAPERVPL